MPRSLRRQETLEVNGCVSRDGKPVVKGDTSKSSFALKLVGRFPHDHDGAGGSTLKTLTAVRFFFPEFQGYLQASSNPDKGETLDALPGDVSNLEENGSGARLLREGRVPAHLPYLKPLVSSNAAHPDNRNGKSIWRFEPLDPTAADVVCFYSPLRIRHVATGKYLAIVTDEAARVTEAGSAARTAEKESDARDGGGADADDQRALSPEGGSDLRRMSSSVVDDGSAGGEIFFDCALVDGVGLATDPTLVFQLLPTANTGRTLMNGISTVRIAHIHEDALGTKFPPLYFTNINDFKPALVSGTSLDGDGSDERHSSPSKRIRNRVGFSVKKSGSDIFKVIPALEDADIVDKCMAYLPIFKLYAHRYKTDEQLPLDLCEQLISVVLMLIDDLTRGEFKLPGTMADLVNEANSLQAAAFALKFGGEPEVTFQNATVDIKLIDAIFDAALAPYCRGHDFGLHDAHGDYRPFAKAPANHLPAACQKCTYGRS